jgi:hypothetical protein
MTQTCSGHTSAADLRISRAQVAASAMEEYGRLVVREVPVPAGHQRERLNLAIDPLAIGDGDPMLEVDRINN